MADKEIKVKKALKHLKDRKERVRIKRKIDNVPQVALIGYTNAGKINLKLQHYFHYLMEFTSIPDGTCSHHENLCVHFERLVFQQDYKAQQLML